MAFNVAFPKAWLKKTVVEKHQNSTILTWKTLQILWKHHPTVDPHLCVVQYLWIHLFADFSMENSFKLFMENQCIHRLFCMVDVLNILKKMQLVKLFRLVQCFFTHYRVVIAKQPFQQHHLFSFLLLAVSPRADSVFEQL